MANRQLFTLSSVLALSACALTGHAQSAPTPQFGIVPMAKYQTYDVDAVNMDNGNDIVKIPLFSLPQLGKLALSFSAVSNTTTWQPDYSCSPDGTSCEYYYTVVSPTYGGLLGAPAPTLGPTIVPDNLPWINWSSFYYPDCILEDNGNQLAYCISTYWSVNDGTGGHTRYITTQRIRPNCARPMGPATLS